MTREKLECPRCHQRSIPVWRKQILGPATSATCPACGGKVGVPWWSMWMVVPFLAAIIAGQFIGSFAIAAVVVIAGAAVMALLYHKYVPLIPK